MITGILPVEGVGTWQHPMRLAQRSLMQFVRLFPLFIEKTAVNFNTYLKSCFEESVNLLEDFSNRLVAFSSKFFEQFSSILENQPLDPFL
jgi:hypothetical protein